MAHLVGQVAVGTLADLVLWKPENFGNKTEMVLKSGVIAWAQVRWSATDFCFTWLLTATIYLTDGRCQRVHSFRSAILWQAYVGLQVRFGESQFGVLRLGDFYLVRYHCFVWVEETR